MLQLANFINNEFSPAQSGRYYYCELEYQVPDSTTVDLQAAIMQIDRTPILWASAEERGRILLNIAELLSVNAQKLAEAEARDTHNSLVSTAKYSTDIAQSIFSDCAHYLLYGQRNSGNLHGDNLNYSVEAPFGLIILQFLPYTLFDEICNHIAPALAAGNSIVLLAPEHTPMTSHILAEIVAQSDLPPGVLNIIFGKYEQFDIPSLTHTDARFSVQRSYDYLTTSFFSVAAKTSYMKPQTNLEVIFADGNYTDMISTILDTGFVEANLRNLLTILCVEQKILDFFVADLKRAMGTLSVGSSFDPANLIGTVHPAKLDEITTAINALIQAGGSVVTGGTMRSVGESSVLDPTIIQFANVPDLDFDEFFAPIIVVIPFSVVEKLISQIAMRFSMSNVTIWTYNVTTLSSIIAEIPNVNIRANQHRALINLNERIQHYFYRKNIQLKFS